MSLLLACLRSDPNGPSERSPDGSTPTTDTSDTQVSVTGDTSPAAGSSGATGDTALPPDAPYPCPDPVLFDEADIVRHTVNPCVLDPTVTLCMEEPYVDTHTEGQRLHRAYFRADGERREELLLFIPPGPGKHNSTLMQWLAYAGYMSINVGWQTDPIHGEDDDASWREFVYGTGTIPEGDIGEHDALMGRLDALMAHMVETQPTEGWDHWWTEAGGMQWDKVVLVGWSDGASAATYIARDHQVAGVLAISGPKYKEWLPDPRLTPGGVHRLFFHQGEGMPDETLAFVVEGLGLDPTVVDADAAVPPYGDAQILTTARTDFQAGFCTTHQAMAMDQCMDEDLIVPYLHLACTLTESGP